MPTLIHDSIEEGEEEINTFDRFLQDEEKTSAEEVDPPFTSDSTHENVLYNSFTPPSEIAAEPLAEFLLFGEASVLNATIEQQPDQQHTDPHANRKYPGNYVQKYGEDQWTKEHATSNCFIRCQSRSSKTRRRISELDIELAALKSFLPAWGRRFRIWFHATGHDSAEKKRKSGPIMSKGRLDLAVNEAFYLNPHFDDCYEWLLKKNSVYRGKHAILIYRFDFEDLRGRGKELNMKEWKQVALEWSTVQCPDDWTYTFQNSDPENIIKQGQNVTPRFMSNGEVAMQLIIRKEKLCQQIHHYLVGCIFFESFPDVAMNSASTKSPFRRNENGNDIAQSSSNKPDKQCQKSAAQLRNRARSGKYSLAESN